MAGALNVTLPKPTVLQPSEEEKQLVQGYQKETERLGERLAPLDAQRTKLEGEMAQIQAPPAPKLQQVPEFHPRELQHGEMLTFATVAMALAGIGAKALHGDIVTALNGAAGAIKGFNEGNLQQAKLDIQNFNTKMGAVVEKNNAMLAEYKAIIEDRKLTLEQKMNQYRIVSAKYQDEIGMAAMRKGDIAFALERQEKLRTANWQAEQLWQRTNASLMAQAIRVDAMLKMRGVGDNGGSSLTPEAIDDMAAFLISNGRMPVGMARGMSAQDLQVIQNRAAAMRSELGLTAQDFAMAGPIAHTKLSALGQLERARNANQSFERMLVLNIQKLKELSAKVSRSGSPYANRSILWLQQNAAGDTDVAEYLFQVNTVQAETARILSNMGSGGGQLTDSARQEMHEVISPAYTPEQLNRVADRAIQDAGNRSRSYDIQVDQVIKEIRDPLHAAGGTHSPTTSTPMRSKSKSGKPIISHDGGKTWEYESGPAGP